MTNMNDSAERKVALITGITGQDGSYLSEFLLDKGYQASKQYIASWQLRLLFWQSKAFWAFHF